jgi:hypothetical protein
VIPYTPFLPQAAHATSSPSRHHDLYAHMHSHTTKVGEGSVSPATIATKALQVMARLARNAAVEGRAVLEDDVARAGGGGGDGGDDDDGAEPDTQTYHFDPMQASDAYETDVGDGENYEAYADDYEYAAAEKDETSADLGRYRRSADTPDYRPDEGTPGGRRSEQVSEEYWSGNVGRFASLGDAAPAMSDEKQEGARKGKRTEKEAALVAADTLRAMGATSQPYQTKPPSAQLGGVRKVGSETFLDDSTNSFEDDLRRELDDAAEEGRTREAAKKLKKEKAAKKEKAKAKKAKAKAAKAKKSEEKLAADTLETETLEAEKTQASHTEGRGETASASLGKAFSKQKRGSKESTKKHGTRFDDDDDDETTHVRSGVKTVSIDDLFQAIGDGDLGDASGDGTGTGTGDDLFQDGDASGDDDSAGDETRRGSSGGAGISWKNDRGFDDTPSKNGGEFVTKLGGHGGRKHSAKTVSDSDETSLFLKAMSKKGVSRDDSSAAASQIATSFRDKNTKISITSSDGHENHFTIGDLGFDDLPGIDDQAVRMYVEGGREYFRYGLGRFPNPDTVYCPSLTTRPSLKGSALHTAQVHCSARLRPTVYSYTLRSTPTLADSQLTLSFLRRSELYEKGADWVNERYETTVNATSLWVDEYAESGRSKKRVTVDVFVDVSDPYSLELMLGPIQNLLKMDLGPLQWRFHARVNAGQGLRKRVNCGGEIAGSPARTSCVANAAVQCSQRTFQNMTSGLGRFEKRAEEIKQRRAQVERAKAALGMDGNFRKLSKNSFEDEEHKNFGSGFWNLPGTKKQSVESVVSLPEHPVRQVRERLVGRDFSARRRSASNSGVVGTRRRRALAANPDAQPDDGDLSVEVDSVDSDEFVSSEATRTSNDYVPDQDTFVDLFEPDDSVAPEVRIGPFSNPKTVCRLSRVITHTHYERLTLFFYTHSTRTTPARAWTSTSTTYRFRLSWTRVRRPKSRRRTARMTRLPR